MLNLDYVTAYEERGQHIYEGLALLAYSRPMKIDFLQLGVHNPVAWLCSSVCLLASKLML